MKVSLKWLEQYFDKKLDGPEIEDILTRLGLEVEERTDLGSRFDKVVAGRIEKIEKHPDADKLQICRIDVGGEGLLQIVTAAPNVEEGMMVPVALVGARVVGGDIKDSKLRGVQSSGMLCSGAELGIDASLLTEEQKQGILPLDQDLAVGTSLKEVLDLDDQVLELGLTPNRADCYGIYNVAKELVLKKELELKALELLPGIPADKGIQVEIRDEHLCHRYMARVIRNVKVAPSPRWFANLLRNVGIRPISNLVDITNYVMFELGHPMHAFDLGKLEGGRIVVEKAAEGEKFITLDGQERTLDGDMLMIRDGVKSIALAGVMGGYNSEVDDTTVDILLEAAHFNSESIRKTSRKLGLRSEASGRFERGLSEDNILLAMNRAMFLVQLLGAGEPEEGYREGYPVAQKKPVVRCSAARINKILGMEIPEVEIEDIFRKLQFKVGRDGDKLLVEPEAHRIDIQGEIDLVEEVVRVYGYDNIPSTLPEGMTNTLKVEYKVSLVEKVKELLTSNGLNEIVSYSFIDPKSYPKLGYEFEASPSLRVMNPLSETQSVMRERLLPGIIEIASRNYKRQRRQIDIFEIGRVYKAVGERLPREELHLGIFLLENTAKSWYGAEQNDFYTLKGIAENLLKQISDETFRYIPVSSEKTFHPGRTAAIMAADECIGYIGELHPLILEEYDIREKACYLEIDLTSFQSQAVKQYSGLPRHPFIERDMALIVPKAVSYAQLEQVIREASSNKVIRAKIFDIYEGAQIGDENKSVAFSLIYQDPERTLTDEEVALIHSQIVGNLENKLGAKLR